MRILFPTNFSDACFRTIQPMAQLADSFELDLTIAHCVNRPTRSAHAEHEIHSFLSEADQFGRSRRLILEGDPVAVISKLACTEPFDLVMCPASDQIGLGNNFSRSIRADLIASCPAPLWTMRARSGKLDFSKRIRRIACLVDFDDNGMAHLPHAINLAQHLVL